MLALLTVSGLLLTLLSLASTLLALLTLLSALLTLSSLLLALLTLLPALLSLLALLPLLALLLALLAALQVCHLLTEFLRLATKHLLLETLLRELAGIGLLLLAREVFLTTGELFQFIHRVVDLLLRLSCPALLTGGTGIGFVLILFLIEFKISQIGEIATGSSSATTAASTTAAAADLDLNVA